MCFPRPRELQSAGRVAFLLLSLLAASCGGTPDPAADIVAEAIRTHGGDRFERVEVTFGFRGADFRVLRDRGRFLYERRYTDPEGRQVREGMENSGTWREVEGERVTLPPDEQGRVETAVNSVVYFGFLPFRLDDPAVVLREMEEEEVDGELYRRVEVTFREEDGGDDWEDRFVYWFHATDHTLDYLAYRYFRGEGGTRFRRAVNRRTVGGILVQDYENYAPLDDIGDIADFHRMMEEGGLRLLSMVELDDVEVAPAS